MEYSLSAYKTDFSTQTRIVKAPTGQEITALAFELCVPNSQHPLMDMHARLLAERDLVLAMNKLRLQPPFPLN